MCEKVNDLFFGNHSVCLWLWLFLIVRSHYVVSLLRWKAQVAGSFLTSLSFHSLIDKHPSMSGGLLLRGLLYRPSIRSTLQIQGPLAFNLNHYGYFSNWGLSYTLLGVWQGANRSLHTAHPTGNELCYSVCLITSRTTSFNAKSCHAGRELR